jgi:tetratricopeptide (TPR) repeat protein
MDILSFFDFRGRRRAKKLYAEARELVENGSYEEALAIAQKLRELRYSGAYEIEGLAYAKRGNNEEAVRVLREGLELAPGVWLNWMLLGSCLSNLGRYDEALLAYDRAAACEHAEPPVIALNRAIVAGRQGDYEAALRQLDTVHEYESVTMRLRATGTRIDTLHHLGREAEAEDLASRTLHEWRDSNATEGKVDIGEIAILLGQMRLERGENPERLRREANDWWRLTRHEPLLWLIRDLRPLSSPDGQYFRLVLQGKFTPERAAELDAQGFFASVDVVAGSVEEALALYLELEGAEEGLEVTVEEAEALEPRPGGRIGVYGAQGRVYYKASS